MFECWPFGPWHLNWPSGVSEEQLAPRLKSQRSAKAPVMLGSDFTEHLEFLQNRGRQFIIFVWLYYDSSWSGLILMSYPFTLHILSSVCVCACVCVMCRWESRREYIEEKQGELNVGGVIYMICGNIATASGFKWEHRAIHYGVPPASLR